jgi:hypothetical protein
MKPKLRLFILLMLMTVLAVGGCRASGPTSSDLTSLPAVPRRGRTQMWAQNCNRCHNARPASWYSQREWEVAMHHMHVRGYLTGEEARGIMEFFRASK